jgi:prevent-host-death family protein
VTTVGIRELRQRASELLRQVERGETIEITDRGRPVAVLAPHGGDRQLERLRRSGELQPAEGSIEDLPQPLPLPLGAEPPSSVLARLRADER